MYVAPQDVCQVIGNKLSTLGLKEGVVIEVKAATLPMFFCCKSGRQVCLVNGFRLTIQDAVYTTVLLITDGHNDSYNH